MGSNTLIVYATAPGEAASDGAGRNSPFTASLLKHIETPGLEIELMFKRVTADVLNSTSGTQQPERLSRLQSELVLSPTFGTIPWEPENTCDGLLVSVAQSSERPCINPGSGHSFRDCRDCPEMLIVPSGSFTMGSPDSEPGRIDAEGPSHKVTIARPFAVSKFPVTRGEFEVFVKATGYAMEGCSVWLGDSWREDAEKSYQSPGFAQTGLHPVVCVNWDDAKAYVDWLSKRTGKVYRLLSEA